MKRHGRRHGGHEQENGLCEDTFSKPNCLSEGTRGKGEEQKKHVDSNLAFPSDQGGQSCGQLKRRNAVLSGGGKRKNILTKRGE